MKKLFILLLITVTTVVAHAQGIVFEKGTLAEAVAKAAKSKNGQNKLFLDCYTSWCGPCKTMAEKVFTQEKVGEFFNANFVNIKIDMEKGEGIELAKKFELKAYPTFIILDKEGNEINRVIGGGDAESFIEKVKVAMNPDNSPKSKLNAYNANKNFGNALAYLELLQESSMDEEKNKFMDEVFNTIPLRQKYTNKMWPFINSSLKNYQSGIYKEVVREYPLAIQTLGKDKVNALITQNIKGYITAFITGKIKDASIAELRERVDVLYFVNNGDKLASKLAEVAECVIANDYSKMIDIYCVYYPGMMFDLNYRERAVAEEVLEALKGKVEPRVYALYYRSMAIELKRWGGDYEKVAEPYKEIKY